MYRVRYNVQGNNKLQFNAKMFIKYYDANQTECVSRFEKFQVVLVDIIHKTPKFTLPR